MKKEELELAVGKTWQMIQNLAGVVNTETILEHWDKTGWVGKKNERKLLLAVARDTVIYSIANNLCCQYELIAAVADSKGVSLSNSMDVVCSITHHAGDQLRRLGE